MRSAKRILGGVLCAVLAFCAVFAAGVDASAINTVFMVPPIDKDYVHHNTLYLSPNYNITALSWGYGTTVDILNTTGDLDSLLNEVFANVTPKGGERIMGIYMEGAGLTEANAADIANAGWTKLEMYYETFLVSCPPVGATRPDIQLVENARIGSVLSGAGFADEFAVLEVTGVNSTWAYLMKYDPALSFMHGKTPRVYKYLPDVGRFVQVEEVYFDSYDRNFLEWDHPQLIEPDMNGLYVATAQALPEELLSTPDDVASLRANPPSIPNTEGNVQWKMSPGLVPDNFTAEAVITTVAGADKDKPAEVNVDFAYSGELPEGTTVTLSLAEQEVSYTDGTQLYLYYCHPDSGLREFVSSAPYSEGQVTFEIYHCSQYIVTDVDHGESYLPEPETPEEPVLPEAPVSPQPDDSEPPYMPDAPIDPNYEPNPYMPSVPVDSADREPLYSKPLKSPNTMRIITLVLLSVIAAASVVKLVLTIVKKKK